MVYRAKRLKSSCFYKIVKLLNIFAKGSILDLRLDCEYAYKLNLFLQKRFILDARLCPENAWRKTIFTKSSILDVRLGSKYVSA